MYTDIPGRGLLVRKGGVAQFRCSSAGTAKRSTGIRSRIQLYGNRSCGKGDAFDSNIAAAQGRNSTSSDCIHRFVGCQLTICQKG
jgi:hypothetical protein